MILWAGTWWCLEELCTLAGYQPCVTSRHVPRTEPMGAPFRAEGYPTFGLGFAEVPHGHPFNATALGRRVTIKGAFPS